MIVDGYHLLKNVKGAECGDCLKFIYSVNNKCTCESIEITGDQFDFNINRIVPWAKVNFKIYDILVNLETGYRTLLPVEDLSYD